MSYYNYKVLYKKSTEKFSISNKIEGLKFYNDFKELIENNENIKKYDIRKDYYSNDYIYLVII